MAVAKERGGKIDDCNEDVNIKHGLLDKRAEVPRG